MRRVERWITGQRRIQNEEFRLCELALVAMIAAVFAVKIHTTGVNGWDAENFSATCPIFGIKPPNEAATIVEGYWAAATSLKGSYGAALAQMTRGYHTT